MATAFFTLLLLPLLFRLVLSTSFVTTTTSPQPSATVTTYQNDFPAHCFDCGPGVDRLDAGTAANAACHYWFSTIMYPPGGANSGGLGFIYAWSGGNIYLSVVPFWMSMGCGSAVTYNDFFAHAEKCYYSFMTPIDSCNTDGVDGKQGGYWYDWCANVTINPNPDGCYNADTDIVETHNRLSDSGIQVATHHATDEEHETAKLSLLEWAKASPHASYLESAAETKTEGKTEDGTDTNAAIKPDKSVAKRDPSLAVTPKP